MNQSILTSGNPKNQRSPLCRWLTESSNVAGKKRNIVQAGLTEANDAHFQRPDPPNPDFKTPVDALDIVKVHAFPPAPAGRLAPEQQQLLRHAHGVVARIVAADVAAQPGERETADDGLVRLAGTVAPLVVVIEATET